jgi:hypothetical protein
MDALDPRFERRGVVDRSTTGGREQRNPTVDTFVRRLRLRTPAVTGGGEAFDVGLRQGGERQRHRRQDARCQASATEDHVDQRPPRAPVAVDEVNGLELGVDDGGLGHSGEAVVVDEGAEILEQALDVVRRRWDESSGARDAPVAEAPTR